MAASRKGRLVLAVVPSTVGLKYATPKDATKMAAHAHISNAENGDGLLMGSAGISCVFTTFLTTSAVYPATASEANQPPTRNKKRKTRCKSYNNTNVSCVSSFQLLSEEKILTVRNSGQKTNVAGCVWEVIRSHSFGCS